MACTLSPYGTYETADQCNHNCLILNAVCDGNGGYRSPQGDETGKPQDQFTCYTCDKGEIKLIADGVADGNRGPDDVCLYRCEGDEKKVNDVEDKIGVEYSDLFCDSRVDESSYLYSPYTHFVRRNGKCVAVPKWTDENVDQDNTIFVQKEGEDIYDSYNKCADVKTPQQWTIESSTLPENMLFDVSFDHMLEEIAVFRLTSQLKCNNNEARLSFYGIVPDYGSGLIPYTNESLFVDFRYPENCLELTLYVQETPDADGFYEAKDENDVESLKLKYDEETQPADNVQDVDVPDGVTYTPYGTSETIENVTDTFSNVQCDNNDFTVKTLNTPYNNVCGKTSQWRIMRYNEETGKTLGISIVNGKLGLFTDLTMDITTGNDNTTVYDWDGPSADSAEELNFVLDENRNLVGCTVRARTQNGGTTLARVLPEGHIIPPDDAGMYHFFVELVNGDDPHRYTLFALGDADACVCKVCDKDNGVIPLSDDMDLDVEAGMTRNDLCEQKWQCDNSDNSSTTTYTTYGCNFKGYVLNPQGGWDTEAECQCFYCNEGECTNRVENSENISEDTPFFTRNQCEGSDRMCGWKFSSDEVCTDENKKCALDASGTYCAAIDEVQCVSNECYESFNDCLSLNPGAVMGLPASLEYWTWGDDVLDFRNSVPTVEYDDATGLAWLWFTDTSSGKEYGIRRDAFNAYYDRVTTLSLSDTTPTTEDVYVLRHAQLSLNTIIDSINEVVPTSMNQFFGGC